MKIGTICRRSVVTVDSGATLTEAARLMREKHVGSLVVTARTTEGPRAVGIVTDRDLAIDVLARGLEGAGLTIGELAGETLASIAEDADLSSTIAAMQSAGVRRLIVVNAEHQVTGIVSLDDLMEACAGIIGGLADIIRTGIEREVRESTPPPVAPVMLRIPAMGTAGWGAAVA